MARSATQSLSRREYGLLAVALMLLMLFGALTVYRTALGDRRLGDLPIFAHAAWAVSVGRDLYQQVDHNGWHYNYPPLFALAMRPFADPASGGRQAGYLPFAVSAGLFYLVNLAALVGSVHVLARALERSVPDSAWATQPIGCRRWWALRCLPLLVCLVPLGHTLMRGQVNILVMACLTAALAGLLRQQSFRAGLWLSLAICIKVIPAFLLIWPLWKRDGRCLGGCALGLVAGLVVAPVLVMGPERTATSYAAYARTVLGPGLGLSDDRSRYAELIAANRSDSQSLHNLVFNWFYPTREHRPERVSPWVVWPTRLMGLLLTLWVLTRKGQREAWQSWRTVQQWGLLMLLMVMLSPASHPHYFALALPLVMVLVARQWNHQTDLSLGALPLLFSLFFLAHLLGSLPGLGFLRELCLATYGALALGAVGMVQIRRADPSTPQALADEPTMPLAA